MGNPGVFALFSPWTAVLLETVFGLRSQGKTFFLKIRDFLRAGIRRTLALTFVLLVQARMRVHVRCTNARTQ